MIVGGNLAGTEVQTPGQVAAWRALLQNRSYVALWIGQMIAQAGDPFRQMALQVFVYELTGSAVALGALATIQAIPALIVGPIAGVLVDRWDRRRIMLVSQAVRALLVLVLVLQPSLPTVYLVGVGAASIGLFYLPARNALLPMIVRRDQLLTANSYSMTTGTLMMLVAPALASLVIGLWGTPIAFGINAASFALAALAVIPIRVPPAEDAARTAAARESAWWADLREGLGFVRRTPFIRGLLLVFGIQMLGFSAMPVLQIIFVDKVLGLPPSALGYLMSFFAVGMLAGGVLVASLGDRIPHTRLITLSAIGYGAMFILLANATWLPFTFLVLALMGVCEATMAVAVPTLLQRVVPDELRGRVFSVQNVVLTAVNILGMGIAGMAAEAFRVETVVMVGGAISLCGGLLGFWVLRESHVNEA